tara:strand:- start:8617 stop:8859 length:243 start_codon:yes stop_codon:yes gene_type:complete
VSEKLEIIRTAEGSHLPVKQSLDMLGIPRTTFYPLRDVACSQRVWSKLRLVDNWQKISTFFKKLLRFSEQWPTLLVELKY